MKNEPGRGLELRIPPGVLVILFGLVMWMAGRFAPRLNFDFPFRTMVAAGLGVLGLSVCALGFAKFRRARTTVNPMKPQGASSLVSSGIYERTRNPMYLGFLLILAGWLALNANGVGIFALPLFVMYMNRFQIEPEERVLGGIFGEEFGVYCSRVRRWI